jgi:SAM-dependent methyltransferase
MSEHDEIAAANQRHWERMVEEGCGFTQPWLNLNRDILRRYAAGRLDPVPEELVEMYPAGVLVDVEGRDVLCLASGGGQQSAVFGVLGTRVTVVDLVEGQLEGDRAAMEHYGYEVTTICADMRNLSCLEDETFDLVYQAPSMSYVPDVREVYAEVARVLRDGGLYRVSFTNPVAEFIDWNTWDGQGYRIAKPYRDRIEGPDEGGAGGSIQFRHSMTDIFNGLLEVGLSVREVQDDPQYFRKENVEAPPGTWAHLLTSAGMFAIVARKSVESS